MTLDTSAAAVPAPLVAVLVGVALGAVAVIVRRRRREAARARALLARLGPRTETRECLECGATYGSGDLFCTRCGAWPGQTG